MATQEKPARIEGDFMDASDLMHIAPVTLTIAAVVPPGTESWMDGKRERVIEHRILAFEGAAKRLILNRTNERLVKALYGPRSAEWVGKEITLAARYVKAFGQNNCPAIRVILPDGSPIPQGARPHLGRKEPSE